MDGLHLPIWVCYFLGKNVSVQYAQLLAISYNKNQNMKYSIGLSIATLFIGATAQLDEPTACCEAYPLVIGRNIDEGSEGVLHSIVVATSPSDCCTTCRETEGCEAYTYLALDIVEGDCVMFTEKHDLENLVPLTFGPVYSGNNNFPDEECDPADCTSELDIFILLDKSESVHKNGEHSDLQIYLENFLRQFRYANDRYGTRASVTMFGGNSRKLIQLNSDEATDVDAIVDAITFEEEPNLGWTDLAKTFRYLMRKELPKSRKRAEKLILIVSDGKVVKNTGSAKRELARAQKILRRIKRNYKGTSVYSIGVGNYNLGNLFKLSTVHKYWTFLTSDPFIVPLEALVSESEIEFIFNFFVCANNNIFETINVLDERSAGPGLKEYLESENFETESDLSLNLNDNLYTGE